MKRTHYNIETKQLSILGPVTFDTAMEVASECKKVLPKIEDAWVVTFGQMTKCDSSSLSIVTLILKLALKHNKDIKFTGISGQFKNLCRVSGIDNFIPLLPVC